MPRLAVVVTAVALLSTGAAEVVCGVLAVSAQRGGGFPGAGPPPAPRASAPVDLTGYWISLITEDWRYRVTTPPKGDYASVPLNPTGRKAADGWDPARDAAAGEQCRAYGVGGVLRLPGRLHLTWSDDRTLRLEMDAGSHERLLSFGPPPVAAAPGWQGTSRASWDRGEGPMGGALLFGGAARSSGASLKVVTTGMKPGYLRRNGVPYSGDAVITEYFDRLDVPGGDTLLVVTIEVVDPAYLSQPFWTSVQFKRQPDAAGWRPTPCA